MSTLCTRNKLDTIDSDCDMGKLSSPLTMRSHSAIDGLQYVNNNNNNNMDRLIEGLQDIEIKKTDEESCVPIDPWCNIDKPYKLNFTDVSLALHRIKDGIRRTDCQKSEALSRLYGMDLFMKREFQQVTGCFKERGARNALMQLTQDQRRIGVIAASAGNHALALSYHGQDLGIPVTVVMPLSAPLMKISSCKTYNAEVIVQGQDMSQCKEIAMRLGNANGLTYINGYDHPHVLAGAGTVGLEIMEQVRNVDAILVPVGGGGLIAGIAVAVKQIAPDIKIIGIEAETCPGFQNAIKSGVQYFTKSGSTLADGLAVPRVGVNSFHSAKDLIDQMISVSEHEIALGILRLVEIEKAVVEGAGAVGLAAIIASKLPQLKGKRVVIPLCGGNIDSTVLGRCIERGLVADGRLVRLKLTVSDRPGGIAELAHLLASIGVSIKDIYHERAWITTDIFSVQVRMVVETRDFQHVTELTDKLRKVYTDVMLND